jgi:hypothetical protein
VTKVATLMMRSIFHFFIAHLRLPQEVCYRGGGGRLT